MNCALCKNKLCYEGKDCTSIKENAVTEYLDESNRAIMAAAASIEAGGYMKLTRIEELISYCNHLGLSKLGLAFCVGLENEAEILYKILSKHFQVSSVCCKVCGVKKDDLALKKLEGGSNSTCNPIGQALVLNQEKTELNIVLGLCMGHDILFQKYSEAPVTTIAVKDRVLAHNPLAALYSGFYRKRRFKLE